MQRQTLTMTDAISTAKMLSEALPYLQRFEDAVVGSSSAATRWAMTRRWRSLRVTWC